MLYLVCRHELVLKDIFKNWLVSHGSPEIGPFKRFRDKWAHIDKEHFKTAFKDQVWANILKSVNNLAWCSWVFKETYSSPTVNLAVTIFHHVFSEWCDGTKRNAPNQVYG